MSDRLVTIIIPTKNQHRKLHGTLNYYHKNRFRGHIVIADYSTGRSINAVRKVYDKWTTSLHVTFTHCDNAKHEGAVIQSVLNYITTPYVLSCDENDQVILKGLSKCVVFLDMNRKYVAASGTKCVVTQHGATEGIHYIPCLNLDTPYIKERLSSYLRTRLSVLHYLHRTEVWKEMFRYAHLTPHKWIGAEVLPCAISVMKGGICDVLRASPYKAIFKREETPVRQKLSDFASEDYAKSMKILRSVILKHLVEGGMTRTEARKLFERELWLSILMFLMYKFTEQYPHLKASLDSYSAVLETYPFMWRRSQLTSSLTQEPDLLRLFKKEKKKYGRSDPFTSE